MKKLIPTKIHTVFLLVGPSGCGKSTFAATKAIELHQKILGTIMDGDDRLPNVQVISSDEIRQQLLGSQGWHRHDARMLQVSDAAFRLLHAQIEETLSWPQLADFVFIDTTGLSKEFRDKVTKQARDKNYRVEAIVFDYKKRGDYFDHLDETYSKKIITQHMTRLREEIGLLFGGRSFDKVHKILNKDFDNYEFQIQNLEEYSKNFLPKNFEYELISDIQGCYYTLVNLLTKRGFTVTEDGVLTGKDNVKLIFLGDLIDKGRYSREVLEFADKNKERVHLIIGNHENYVYKHLEGKLEEAAPPEIVESYFTTVAEFTADPRGHVLLKRMTEEGAFKPFLIHREFITTHAPCQNKYLGRLTSRARAAQRNFSGGPRNRDFVDNYDGLIKAMEETYSFIRDEAVSNHPKHFFGHLALNEPIVIKNKWGFDTGACSGNKLTCVFKGRNGKWMTDFVDADERDLVEARKESLPTIFKLAPKHERLEVNLDDLDALELRRLRRLAKAKINFISGTMSPSDKSEGELESLATAFDYYRRQGVERVFLQKKYMGSRCQIYLNKDPEKCYAVSRNGFTITPNKVDLTNVYQAMLVQQSPLMNSLGFEEILLDGELMPWAALGRGLIEGNYRVVERGLKSEIDLLEETGFEEALAALSESDEYAQFREDKNLLKKDDLVKKYGHARFSTFRAMYDAPRFIPIEEQRTYLDVFSRQLELFGAPGDPSFLPFALLKGWRSDGTEEVFVKNEFSNSHYREISTDEMLAVSLKGDDYAESLRTAEEFFVKISLKEEMEGVVVKPDAVYTPGLAPYLKVRNPSYLSLIYGYDYREPEKLAKLIQQKSIRGKLRTSIAEFDLGRKLLEISRAEISFENQEYLQLAAKIILEERHERSFDPRL